MADPLVPQALAEKVILERMEHPFVVRLHHVMQSYSQLFLVRRACVGLLSLAYAPAERACRPRF